MCACVVLCACVCCMACVRVSGSRSGQVVPAALVNESAADACCIIVTIFCKIFSYNSDPCIGVNHVQTHTHTHTHHGFGPLLSHPDSVIAISDPLS